MGIREDAFRAIGAQESGNGTNPAARKVNAQGVFGDYQMQQGTFEGMKANGMIPKDFQFTNNDNVTAAARVLVNHYFDKYGEDNPAAVFAAYYGGEKAVRPDGSIVNFGNKTRPQDPTTVEYANQVLGRMGMQPTVGEGESAVTANVQKLDARDVLTTPFPDPTTKLQKPAKGTKESVPWMIPIGDGPAETRPLAEEVVERQAGFEAEQAKKDKTSGWDLVKANFETGITWSIIKNFARPDADNVPGFVPAWEDHRKRLGAISPGEYTLLSNTTGPASERQAMQEIEDRREAEAVQARGSGFGNFVAAMAGDSALFLAGAGAVGAATNVARVGSAGLAARGSLTAARVSSLAENVGVNLAFTAAQDAVDPFINHNQYLFDGAMGLLGFGLQWRGLGRTFAAGEMERAGASLRRAAAADEAALQARASENLGAGALPEALEAEVARLKVERAKAAVVAADAPPTGATRESLEDISARLAEEDKLQANPERVELDVPVNTETVEDRLIRRRGTANGMDTRSAAVILENLGKDTDAVLGTLAQRLRTHLGGNDIPVHIVDDELRGAVAVNGETNWGGVYLAHSNEIAVAKSNINDKYVYLHEISHALTVTRLFAGQTGRDPKLAATFKEIAGLREQVQAELVKRVSEGKMASGGKAQYYLTNEKEFIAGLYSGNKAFNDLLKSMKVPGKEKTFYSSFVEAIGKLLGLDKQKDLDMFTHMLNKADELMATPATINRVDKETGAIAAADFSIDQTYRKYGIDNRPSDTAGQKAENLYAARLHAEADQRAAAGELTVDESRLSWLMNTSIMRGGQSIANTMARSKSNLVRMLAADLLENPSGAMGRRATAAQAKYIEERRYIGNVVGDYQGAMNDWARSRGDSWGSRLFAQGQDDFDRAVMLEIERRRMAPGEASTAHEAVVKAADSIQAAYERMRVAQKQANTLGSHMLPETSVGYVPHRMDPAAVNAMDNDQLRALNSALSEQFQQLSDFGKEFSDRLAKAYTDRIRGRAMNSHDSPVGIYQVGSPDIIEAALRDMGISEDQVRVVMNRYTKGQLGHTKQRLELDLTREYTREDGTKFQLVDVMNRDQLALIRSMSGKVSGEVALAKFGYKGKPELDTLRRAVMLDESGPNARTAAERDRDLKAFDQMIAELKNEPFGTANQNLNRIMLANVLVRMGGMGLTQAAESINAIWHIGLAKTTGSIADFARLRSEIDTLAKGGTVENSLLSSIEKFAGVDFGLDSHRMNFPFQMVDQPLYGRDTVTMLDKILRGGVNVQGKISLWRTVHSVQQRGMAEQIVSMVGEAVQTGKVSVALKDMGLSEDLIRKAKGAFDMEGGKVVGFDINKMELREAEEFVQAVHRGVGQIIQDTKVGEKGAWAHDGLMRFLTQFRTFGITSVEKQWSRQVGNHGNAAALGMVIGSLSIAAPIYMARVHLASLGKENPEEYINKQLTPTNIIRGSLNLIAMSGLTSDFIDTFSAVSGVGEASGGRAGAQGKGLLGNTIGPGAGLVDDAYKAIQGRVDSEGNKEYKSGDFVKLLPFNRVPYLIPLANTLGN